MRREENIIFVLVKLLQLLQKQGLWVNWAAGNILELMGRFGCKGTARSDQPEIPRGTGWGTVRPWAGCAVLQGQSQKLTAQLLAYLLQLSAQPVKYCFFHSRCSQHFSFVHFELQTPTRESYLCTKQHPSNYHLGEVMITVPTLPVRMRKAGLTFCPTYPCLTQKQICLKNRHYSVNTAQLKLRVSSTYTRNCFRKR